jgi:transcription elongation factor Elf1
MPCPDCGARIVVTIEQILSGNRIVCQCGLALTVDVERSEETLRDLRELQRRLAQGRG